MMVHICIFPSPLMGEGAQPSGARPRIGAGEGEPLVQCRVAPPSSGAMRHLLPPGEKEGGTV